MVMRIGCLSISAGVLLASIVATSALAVDKGTTVVAPVRPTKMSPTKLSSAECKGLGGKVVEVSDCNGMSACITTNQDGVVHKACLTKQ
jgi:hypothetical protein